MNLMCYMELKIKVTCKYRLYISNVSNILIIDQINLYSLTCNNYTPYPYLLLPPYPPTPYPHSLLPAFSFHPLASPSYSSHHSFHSTHPLFPFSHLVHSYALSPYLLNYLLSLSRPPTLPNHSALLPHCITTASSSPALSPAF